MLNARITERVAGRGTGQSVLKYFSDLTSCVFQKVASMVVAPNPGLEAVARQAMSPQTIKVPDGASKLTESVTHIRRLCIVR